MANAKVFLESGRMCIGQACSAQDLREVDLVIPVQFSNRDEVLPPRRVLRAVTKIDAEKWGKSYFWCRSHISSVLRRKMYRALVGVETVIQRLNPKVFSIVRIFWKQIFAVDVE